MGIIDIFKSSTEKKFADKLLKMKRSKIDDDMSDFSKYERMRQSWGEPNESKNYKNQICYKVKNGDYVTKQDIERITKDAKDKGVFATKEFNEYFDYLNQLRGSKSGENSSIGEYKKQFNIFEKYSSEFLNGFKSYKDVLEFVLKNNWVVTKKEQKGICDVIANLQLKLNNINSSLEQLKKVLLKDNLESEKEQTYYLNLADEIQNFMYGENNFYQKYAQKVFSKYKDIYSLLLKCNKEKLEKYVKELNLETEQKSNIFSVLEALRCLSIEAYSKSNNYSKKIVDIESVFLS